MRKALTIGLIAIVLVVSSFTISTLLTPQLSSGTDSIGNQLEIKEIVWDGRKRNGEHLITIENPTAHAL